MSFMLPLSMLGDSDFVTPERFGAKGDDPGNGTGTDDTAAFQAALDSSRRVFLMPNKTYRIHGYLQVPQFQQIIGLGIRSASEFWVETGQTGASRLIFTGSGTACFINKNLAAYQQHGGMQGFIMRALGAYGSMMYFRDCVDWHMRDIGMQTDSLTMNGLVCDKITFNDPSWTNGLTNIAIRLPDASSGRPLDVDWSDSHVEHCYLTGGVGSIDRGYGVRWVSNQIERSSYAGMTCLKAGATDTKSSMFTANSFDANKTHGLLLQVIGDTSSSRKFQIVVNGNMFRTVDPNNQGVAGAASIGLYSDNGDTYTVGPIANNKELAMAFSSSVGAGSWSLPNAANNQ